jgi:hypothetical protein
MFWESCYLRLEPHSAVHYVSGKEQADGEGATYTNVNKLATREATPATIITALAKRSPVPPEAVVETSGRAVTRSPVAMVEEAKTAESGVGVIEVGRRKE